MGHFEHAKRIVRSWPKWKQKIRLPHMLNMQKAKESNLQETKMSKTLRQMKEEAYDKYQTGKNKFSDFPVGTDIKIITPICDFSCFYGETGKVVHLVEGYLGIEIRFDEPRKFRDGTIQTTFNFNPKDLIVVPIKEKSKVKETKSLRLTRYTKWWTGTRHDKSPDIRKNVVENEIRTVGWIAAMNDVRQILRDNAETHNGLIITAHIKPFKLLDEILQKEIEG